MNLARSDLFFNYMFYKMAYFSDSLILAIYTGWNTGFEAKEIF
jgi:hypothetical protein